MMFCCLMGLNLEDWRWPVEMGGPKGVITHDGRPPERRGGGHHAAMGAWKERATGVRKEYFAIFRCNCY